jgi:hypothetical protein
LSEDPGANCDRRRGCIRFPLFAKINEEKDKFNAVNAVSLKARTRIGRSAEHREVPPGKPFVGSSPVTKRHPPLKNKIKEEMALQIKGPKRSTTDP